MSQDGVMPPDLHPMLSVRDGPSWDALCDDLKGKEYGTSLFFRVHGIPSGVRLKMESLSKPNSTGVFVVKGVWLGSGYVKGDDFVITMEYSPRIRQGRVVSISRQK